MSGGGGSRGKSMGAWLLKMGPGGACDPGRGGGDECGAVWVRCDARWWWFGGHGGFGGGMRYARAAYHVVSGGCGGVVGAFKRGLGFDGVAGGMCESACVTVVVEFRLLGPAHLGSCLCVFETWGITFPLVVVVFEPLEFVCIVLEYSVASIASSRLGLLFPSCLLLTSLLFLRVLKHGMYLFLLFSPFSTDPPFLSFSRYRVRVDRPVTGGHHGHLGFCFVGERVCGRLERVGVKFGTGSGIVE